MKLTLLLLSIYLVAEGQEKASHPRSEEIRIVLVYSINIRLVHDYYIVSIL